MIQDSLSLSGLIAIKFQVDTTETLSGQPFTWLAGDIRVVDEEDTITIDDTTNYVACMQNPARAITTRDQIIHNFLQGFCPNAGSRIAT